MATINYYYTKSVLETVSENPMQFKPKLRIRDFKRIIDMIIP